MTTGRRHLQESAERPNPVSAVHVWRTPADAAQDLQIVTHLLVYADIFDHAVSSLPNETGGFLLGHVGRDEQRRFWHVEIDECVPVTPLEQDPVHFSFSWRDVDRVRGYRQESGKALIGWYHTHPGLGIFLSETDLEKTHRVLFGELFQIALVYDPVRGRAGYFFWEASQVIDASAAIWREFTIAPPTDKDLTADGEAAVAESDAAESAVRMDDSDQAASDASTLRDLTPALSSSAAAPSPTTPAATPEERTDS